MRPRLWRQSRMALNRPLPAHRRNLDQPLRDVLLEGALVGLQAARDAVPALNHDQVWDAYVTQELLPRFWNAALEEVGRRYELPGLGLQWVDLLDRDIEHSEIMGLAYDPSAVSAQRQRAAARIGSAAALSLTGPRVPHGLRGRSSHRSTHGQAWTGPRQLHA
jgi:hypothetical protein